MDFPQYRKRFDNKSYYKVINDREMQEVQLVGEKKFFYHIHADKYFEVLRIQEILDQENELYVVIPGMEYEQLTIDLE
jgi:hypothetical protein